MRARVAGVAVALALACAVPCIAAPTAVHGWPVPAPAGSVHQGPGGGAVVVNEGLLDVFEYTVSAYRLDGRRRWVNRRRAGCGNCDTGPQPTRRQADGTYGLIGVTGDDYWSVSQAGRRVAGCTGAVLPDGTCIAAEFPGSRPVFQPRTTLIARRAGTVLWSLDEADLVWSPEFEVAPFTVRDGSGTVYTAYAPERDDGRLVAADAATGALRARVPGSFELLGATADAGLALEDEALVALGPDGVRRWSVDVGRRSFLLSPESFIVDRARERVYVGRLRGTVWSTTAYSTGDGRLLWCSASDRSVRPLSLAQGGLLLVGFRRGGEHAVRALGLDGGPRWTFRTAGEVVGARELVDRTVAVSTERPPFAGRGPLWRIDPLRG